MDCEVVLGICHYLPYSKYGAKELLTAHETKVNQCQSYLLKWQRQQQECLQSSADAGFIWEELISAKELKPPSHFGCQGLLLNAWLVVADNVVMISFGTLLIQLNSASHEVGSLLRKKKWEETEQELLLSSAIPVENWGQRYALSAHCYPMT